MQPSVSDYFLFALLLLFIFVNAIISGSEAAFFKEKKAENKNIPRPSHQNNIRINSSVNKPEELLTSILIAYNSLNIVILVLTFYLLNKLPYFANPTLWNYIGEIAIAAGIILIFVEIMPKLYASSNPKKFSERYSSFIQAVNDTLWPISHLLAKSNIYDKSTIQRKHEISMDELSKALEITSDENTHKQEKDMLKGIIRFKDKTVNDILVSRADLVALDITTPFKKVIDFIIEAGFSRIPVYEGNPDYIKGVLYVKDLLPHLNKPEDFHWQSLIRPAYFVPETKQIDDLLEEFRTNKNHIAIVVDEYGGTSGIVTLEDILEEIVGNISDEYDEDKPLYTIASDGSYIFDGKTPLEDFFKITGIPQAEFINYTEEAETLAGLILEIKGNFPKRKETIVFKNYRFQVEEMNKRRILKIRFIPTTKKESKDAH
ncbi:gliding motility-associated protein GldE [Anaerorudis cellulosivorans]|uniref:gliding motility-associated protein GldE n=1 Tax=Anaerorudis cellulosivorans TaxID=3397862 RepID=UPI00221F1AD8|nr:gliding motility-associated protein GldE [Seramator thermalis]MCW1734940.1 gliding motility-associated protein GldE [Seramator thermalis]